MRERKINRVFIISGVIASVLVISLIGVLIARSRNSARENKFAEELSSFDSSSLDLESASTQIGKSIEESEEAEEFEEAEIPKNVISSNDKNESNTTNVASNATNSTDTQINTAVTTKKNTTSKNNTVETNAKAEKKETKMDFQAPAKGEIIREFAKDSLVFSNTLQEWITHNGIDIKADKTSVVKAAAAGTVSAIKNDPRYGLTVIINHDNGYQTIYSNLLTSEFVVKGEKVEKGQSIGTVGKSASFEVSDDYHLHFELLRNNEYLDPVIYMDFE